jgi:AcrR family transcriptional regulator
MARPKVNPGAPSTPDRILDAAIPVFAGQGYDAAKLADIAAGADIRRPSLLYHFSTKAELYQAVIARVFADLGATLVRAQHTEGDFVTRLRAIYEAYGGFLSNHPTTSRLIVRELIASEGPGRPLFLDAVVPLLDLVETWMKDEGSGLLHEALNVRHALLHVAGEILLRHAAGSVAGPLWGPIEDDNGWRVANRMFLKE